MRRKTLFALFGATLMLLSVVSPAVLADEDGELSIDVEQADDYDATVTITENGTAAAGANVTVSTVPEGRDYAGAGEHVADENGTVELPGPTKDDVRVTITAEYNNSTVSEELTLEGPENETEDLNVSVSQDANGNVTATVTSNGSTVANATMVVGSIGSFPDYGAEGVYSTDENGTVELAPPEEDTRVKFQASYNGSENATVTDIEAPPEGLAVTVTQDANYTPTVTVTDNGTSVDGANVTVLDAVTGPDYDGTGDYVTGADGTVTLQAPNQSVLVKVTAEHNNSSASTTTRLKAPDDDDEDDEEDSFDDGNETDTNETSVNVSDFKNFGQALQAFKASMDADGPPGLTIAAWVVENNPGNAPDHAGPKDKEDHPVFGDDGNETDDGAFNTTGDGDDHPGNGQGPPDHAGPGGDDDGDAEDDGGQGPPDHAGPPDDDDGDAEDDDGGQGPPDHAGPPDDDDDDEEDDDGDEGDGEDDPGKGNGNGNDGGPGNGNGNGGGPGNGNGNGGGPGNGNGPK